MFGFLLIIADVSTGGDMSPLLLPGRLQLAVCGDVTPVPTSDWDPRYQSRHHEVLLSPWIRSVVGHLCSLVFFSTKVGMIGFFCKREMVQWFNDLQDVGGIIMMFCCVYGTELWPNLVFYLLQWSQESSWVCLWVYTQTAMETAHCKCYTPPPPWIYRARK